MGPKEVKGGALTCMGRKEVKVGALTCMGPKEVVHVHGTKGGERWCTCMGPKEVKGGVRAWDQRR